MARPTSSCREQEPVVNKGQCSLKGQFRCEQCSRLFSTKGNLARHVQATHVGGHTFPCPTCGKEFKRKEDRTTHIRVHTGEKPYCCKHPDCGKRFARVSDLRSHERTHRSDAKAFPCPHPGCGKKFTRPYDLKKHQLSQHWTRSAIQLGDDVVRAKSTRGGDRGKRKIPETSAPSDTAAGVSKSLLPASRPLPPVGGSIVDDLLRSNEDVLRRQQQQQQQQLQQQKQQKQQKQQQKQQLERRGEEPDAVVRWVTASPSTARAPPPHPAHAKHSASSPHMRHRKHVRCDAHKHCDPLFSGASFGVVSAQGADKRSKIGATSVAVGTGSADEAKAHVHGASCGHVAVLHENHVDFLMGDGQLECYDGKEKSREGWVSATTEGEGDSSCGCDDTATAAPGAAAATSDGKRHWDGVEPDQPTGRCPGDSHGPQCGHEVVHHDGHLDYVVNGRLIHPIDSSCSLTGDDLGGGEGGMSTEFEDHGSIRTLDDSLVTFLDFVAMLEAPSVNDDMEPFCDLCTTLE